MMDGRSKQIVPESSIEEKNMKKALITGVTGQDGAYLSHFLLDKGYQVHGVRRRVSTGNLERIEHLIDDDNSTDAPFQLHYGDLTDSSNVIRLIKNDKA